MDHKEGGWIALALCEIRKHLIFTTVFSTKYYSLFRFNYFKKSNENTKSVIVGLHNLSQSFGQGGFVGASLSCSSTGGVMSNGLGGGSGVSTAPFSSISTSSIHSPNLHPISSAHANHLEAMGSRY